VPNRVVATLTRALKKRQFASSGDYWEKRYAAGGDSGAGSYGESATSKAEVVNGLVAELGVTSVVEFGCGDGNQLTLAEYPQYLGLDVAKSAVERCETLFAGDATKAFEWYQPEHYDPRPRADMALSLEVLFHLVEDEVFATYLRHLFAAGERYVLIMSSDEEGPAKGAHVRRRAFTPWIERNIEGWRLDRHVPNPKRDGRGGTRSDYYLYTRT
jgi:SAM-dependent methyltransferase